MTTSRERQIQAVQSEATMARDNGWADIAPALEDATETLRRTDRLIELAQGLIDLIEPGDFAYNGSTVKETRALIEELSVRTKIGQDPKCSECGRPKKPIGRAAALAMANGLCDDDCPGYRGYPRPDYLWPGEKPEDFGYPVPHYHPEPLSP